MRKKTIGKCALCGRIGELSFEHIPPKAAFNSTPARPVLDVLTLSSTVAQKMLFSRHLVLSNRGNTYGAV